MLGTGEELKAKGFQNFIVFGNWSTGSSIAVDKIILPSSALRDEGTSYHYAPASDEISHHSEMLLLTMEEALDQAGIEHVRTKTWYYRCIL